MKKEDKDAALIGLVIGVVVVVLLGIYLFGPPSIPTTTGISVMALQPGEQYTDSFTLTSSIPLDTDSSDGYYNALYCQWSIFDANNNTVAEGTPQTLTSDTCNVNIAVTFNATGTYKQVAAIAETHVQYDYANDTWGPWSDFQTAASSIKTITVEAMGAPPSPPTINWISFLLGLIGG